MAKTRASTSRKVGRPSNLERRSTAQTTRSHASEDDAAEALMSLAIASPTSRHGSGPSSLSTPTSPVTMRGPTSAPLMRVTNSGESAAGLGGGLPDASGPQRKRRREISEGDVSFPPSTSQQVNGSRDAMDVDGDVQMSSGVTVNGEPNANVYVGPPQARSRSFTLANHEITVSGGAIMANGGGTHAQSNGSGDDSSKTTGPAAQHVESRKSKPRNIDKVRYGRWEIKTWYHSPYPIDPADDVDVASGAPGKNGASSSKSTFATKKAARMRSGRFAGDEESAAEDVLPILWVCEWCFKYMKDGTMLELHSKFCKRKHPPGRKVYSRGAHFIYEIDGAQDKLYCQNLSLFGKLFIDIKTLFFDLENFHFYVLAEGESNRDHVIGFFSKEKLSYDDYNLATIVVFPPYQRKRYGMLMIEFSYELSRRAGRLGTPERPLSELGLRSYLMYWIQALVQLFRRLLSIQPGDISHSREHQGSVDSLLLKFIGTNSSDFEELRSRSKGFTSEEVHEAIWDRDLERAYNNNDVIAATSGGNDVIYARQRWMRASVNEDGSVTTHAFATCTLEDMSKATGIRMEDIAFALHESGMLLHMEVQDASNVVVVSRKIVEDVARKFNVKRMVMSPQCVLNV